MASIPLKPNNELDLLATKQLYTFPLQQLPLYSQ